MRKRVYLDTSIFGALTDSGPEIRIQGSEMILRKIKLNMLEGIISNLILEEISRAPFRIRKLIEPKLNGLTLIEESSDSLELAEEYLTRGALPQKSLTDARHISVAVTNNIGILLSWNFRHMVNLERKHRINSVNLISR